MPSGMNKVFSVYAQHWRYFDMLKDDVCPQHAFVRDIGNELDEWLEMGNQIVIALDANEDMRHGPVSDAFCKRGLIFLHQEWTHMLHVCRLSSRSHSELSTHLRSKHISQHKCTSRGGTVQKNAHHQGPRFCILAISRQE